MSHSATKQATARYAHKFSGSAAAGHFRENQGLTLSSLGIGTYLGKPDAKTDEGYTAATVAAVENGINVIDAAINYRFQQSERNIGAAIKQLAEKGFPREEIVLCTKGGYLTPDGSMPADPNDYFFREYIQPGVFTAKDIVAGSHCMTPRFLQNQRFNISNPRHCVGKSSFTAWLPGTDFVKTPALAIPCNSLRSKKSHTS
jgi:hypothetical protein